MTIPIYGTPVVDEDERKNDAGTEIPIFGTPVEQVSDEIPIFGTPVEDQQEDSRSRQVPFTDLTATAMAGRPVPGTLLGDMNRDGRLNLGEGIMAVGRQFAYGVKGDLPRMLGDAMKYVSDPGEWFYDQGKRITDWVDQQERDDPGMLEKYEWSKNPFMHVLGGGARMIPQSLGPPLLLAGVAAMLPEAAIAALGGTAVVGAAAALAGAVPAGLSQGQQTYEKLLEAGVDDETAAASSRLTGLIEWGGESVANMLGVAKWPMRMLGIGAKGTKIGTKVAGKEATEYLAKLAMPKTWKTIAGKTINDLARTMAEEVGTEVGQAVGQTYVENVALRDIGQPTSGLLDAAKEVIGPTIGMTMLMGPLGARAQIKDVRRQEAIKKALTDPKVHPEYRAAAALALTKDLYDIDKTAGENFSINASTAVTLGLPLPLSEVAVSDPDAKGGYNQLAHALYQRGSKRSASIIERLFMQDQAGMEKAKAPPSPAPDIKKGQTPKEKDAIPPAPAPAPAEAATEPPVMFQAARQPAYGEQQGRQLIVKSLDEPTFDRMLKPLLATTSLMFQTYRKLFPNHTHIAMTRLPNEQWQVSGVGSKEYLLKRPAEHTRIFKQVQNFDTTEAQAHSLTDVKGDELAPEPIRFEGTQAGLLQNITGLTPKDTPAAYEDADATYIVPLKPERVSFGKGQGAVTIGRLIMPAKRAKPDEKAIIERLFAWDTDRWHRLPSVKDRKSSGAELLEAAKRFVSSENGIHINAVTKKAVEDQRAIEAEADKVGVTLKLGKGDMPTGAFNKKKTIGINPHVKKTEQKEPWYILLNRWREALPWFQGNKREMSVPVTKAARDPESGWTGDNEIQNITEIYEPFGGGGSWGLFLATTIFKFANKITIGELNPARLEMIRYIHQHGNQFFEDVYSKKGANGLTVKQILDMAWKSGTIASGGGLQGQLAKVIKAGVVDKINKLDANQLMMLQIVHDLVSRGSMSPDMTLGRVVANVTGLYNMARQFRAINGENSIVYVSGDAYARDVPQGKHVLTLLDPPYVFTQGYGEDMVPVETYEKTGDLIERAAAAGNNIIYTDSVWWKYDKQPTFKDLSGKDKELAIAEWKEAQDKKKQVLKTDRDRALATLKRIQAAMHKLQPIDLTIGGHRYEVLGMHNAMLADRKGVKRTASKRLTPTELIARNDAIIAALPFKVGQKVNVLATTKWHPYDVTDIRVDDDGTVRVHVSRMEIKRGVWRNAAKVVTPDQIKLTPQQASAVARKERASATKNLTPKEKKAVNADAKVFDKVVSESDYYDFDGVENQAKTRLQAIDGAWHDMAMEMDPDGEIKLAGMPIKIAYMDEARSKSELLPLLAKFVAAHPERFSTPAEKIPARKSKLPPMTEDEAVSMSKRQPVDERQQELALPPAPPTTTQSAEDAEGPRPTSIREGEPGVSLEPTTEGPGAGMDPDKAALYNDNVRLADTIASDHVRTDVPGLSWDEVSREARSKLAEAATRYDPRMGEFRFYAGTAIRRHLRSYRNQQTTRKKTDVSLSQAPTQADEEGEARETLTDRVRDRGLSPARAAELNQAVADMTAAVATLSKSDRAIIEALREGKTQRQIALDIGTSPANVSQRLTNILKRIRAAMEAKGYNAADIADILNPQVDVADQVSLSKKNRAGAKSKKAKQGGRITKAQVEARVSNWISKQAHVPTVRVIDTIDDAVALGLSGESVRMLRDEKPRGFYDRKNDQIVIVADQLITQDEAMEVILHEAVGHFGVEGLFGNDAIFRKAMLALAAEVPAAELQKIADLYAGALPDKGLPEALSSERNIIFCMTEYIAQRAETEQTLWDRFVEIVRKALLRILPTTVVNRMMKRGLIDNLIQSSRDYVREGPRETNVEKLAKRAAEVQKQRGQPAPAAAAPRAPREAVAMSKADTERLRRFESWKRGALPEIVVGWRGERAPGQKTAITSGTGGTEGIGLYIARDKSLAGFFNKGKIRNVYFPQPQNPMVVNDEPLHILHETEDIMQPPNPADSPWTAAHKEAARRVGLTDQNWGEKQVELQRALTDVMLERGHDAVIIKSGFDEWVVILARPEEYISLSKSAGYTKQAFDETAGPFDVQYGTRSKGDKYDTFDTLDEAVAFAKRKLKTSDYVSLMDANGRERDMMAHPAAAPGKPVAKPAQAFDETAGPREAKMSSKVSTPQQDAAYLAAVEKGDRGGDNLVELLRKTKKDERDKAVAAWLERNPETAKRLEKMVVDRARAAGYDIKAYHGTDQARNDLQGGTFVTDNAKAARSYAYMKAIERAAEDNEQFSEILSEIMGEEGAESIQDLSVSTLESIIEGNNIDIDLSAAGETISLRMKASNVLDLTDEGTDVGDVAAVWKRLHKDGLVDDSWESLDEEAVRELKDEYGNKTMYALLEREGVYAKAYSKGYDAVSFMDVSPDGDVHTTWIADKAMQYKSADAITYDDAGRIIPPSERFNEELPDIRMSKKPTQMEVRRDKRGYYVANVDNPELWERARRFAKRSDAVDAMKFLQDEYARALPQTPAPESTDQTMQGEWWIDDGSAQYADGDIGDLNHEGAVREKLMYEAAELLGVNESEIAVIDEWADENKDALIKAGMAEEKVDILRGYGDAREYAMKTDGAVRLVNNDAETWDISPEQMKAIASGIGDAYQDQAEGQTFNIEVSKTGRYYRDVPLEVLERGDMAELARYDSRSNYASMSKRQPQGEGAERSHSNYANPIKIDEVTRERFFRYQLTYKPTHVPKSTMEAQVRPALERKIAEKGVIKLLVDYDVKGFPDGDRGVITAQLLLNTPEYAKLFSNLDDKAAMTAATSIAARYGELGTRTGRALAYRRDDLQKPADRQLAILRLMAMPEERFFKNWSMLTDAQREEAHNKVRKNMADAVKALGKIGVKNFSSIDSTILMNDQKFAQIINTVSEQYVGPGEKIYEYWRNSILSGLHTNIVNVTSNWLHTTWELFVQKPAEALVNMFVQDPNAPTFQSLAAAYRMLWPHITDANRAMVSSYVTETGMFTAIDTKGQTAIGGKWGRFVRTPQRALLAMDEWYKTLLTYSLAYDYATRAADKNRLTGIDRQTFIEWAATTTNGDSVCYEDAHKEAVRILFQEKPGAIGTSLLSARNAPGLTGWVMKFVVPFVTTPANLIKIGVKKSPFGLISMGMNGIAALTSPDSARYRGPDGKARLITDSVEQVIAWSLGALLYTLTAGDDDDDWPWITGSLAGTPNEKRFQQRNIPPHSIRIGDRWYSYARLEPFSTSMSLFVDAMNTWRAARAGKPMSKYDAAKILSLIRDRTYLQSVGDIIRGIEDPEQWVYMSQNFGSSWMPNIARQALRATDPLQRDNRVRERGAAWLGKSLFLRGAQSALPIPDLQTIPRFDHWGRPISKDVDMQLLGQPLSDIAWRMMVPVKVQKATSRDNVDRMIWNWNRINDDPGKAWWPGNTRPEVTFRGHKIAMTDAQYAAYQMRRGDIAMRMAKRIRWNFDNPDVRHITTIQKVFERAGSIARQSMMREIVVADIARRREAAKKSKK